MSDHEKALDDCLFSRQDGAKLVNIKFFRGDDDLIAPESLREQVYSVDLQRRLDLAVRSGTAPKSNRPKVDVRELLANM